MPQAPGPYESLPEVPSFTLRSNDVAVGETLATPQLSGIFGAGGEDRSPHLAWEGFPAETKSFAITCYDPDAPTGSGFWHWVTWDLPAGTTSLDATGPAGSVEGTGDAGAPGYLGPCPPAGDVAHHYEITVYALDTASLALPASTPPAVAAFTMSGHVIGYARLTVTARR